MVALENNLEMWCDRLLGMNFEVSDSCLKSRK